MHQGDFSQTAILLIELDKKRPAKIAGPFYFILLSTHLYLEQPPWGPSL